MDIAQAKRRENIAEYILYLWQLEDLLRALQFSPEAIFSTLIAPRKDIAEEQKHVYLLWYMDIANLLHQEGKDEKGHLEHTLHLIGDLHDLHLQLMKLSVGEHYRQTYAKLEPELPRLRAVVGNPGMNDTELCFRALYAAMLYRIKGEGDKQAVTDTSRPSSPTWQTCTAKSNAEKSTCSRPTRRNRPFRRQRSQIARPGIRGAGCRHRATAPPPKTPAAREGPRAAPNHLRPASKRKNGHPQRHPFLSCEPQQRRAGPTLYPTP